MFRVVENFFLTQPLFFLKKYGSTLGNNASCYKGESWAWVVGRTTHNPSSLINLEEGEIVPILNVIKGTVGATDMTTEERNFFVKSMDINHGI